MRSPRTREATRPALRQSSRARYDPATQRVPRLQRVAPRYLERPNADRADADSTVTMPYGITAEGIVAAINDLYAYLHAQNSASIEYGYDRLEDIMLPAGFSGLLSELVVRMAARELEAALPGVTRNRWPNGRPDLVPRARYPGDGVHQGEEGVEVKVSTSDSSWQGHNPETGWVMIVQVTVDRTTAPVYDRSPTVVERVLIANLDKADWNFAGRSPTSRRTPTASINRQGRDKLQQAIVYQRGRSKGEKPPPVPVPSEKPIV